MDDTLKLACTIVAIAGSVIAAMFLFKKEQKPAMSATEFQPFELTKIDQVSHDTKRFTFKLATPKTRLGLPIGQHISFRFTGADGKGVQRSYTPITGDETLGSVTFMIKIYKAGVHPKFPDGGKMSQHLDGLKVGDSVDLRGPKGHMDYKGRGVFTVKQMRKPLQTRKAKHFGMIAGGTGLTPMLQVITGILKDPKDKTTMSLIYANQTEDDILMRKEIEALAKQYPDRFRFHYTLDRPPNNWGHSTGFINKEMIQRHLPAASSDKSTQILMCGPPPMIKFACLPNLEALGFGEDEWFTF
mmetsp:Transcript_4946/g.7231  ORF Transcript_4946/g.7231 Transcript_4946/m.7231 type:complete len:300 (-) Transcript_4946:125-1024(-)|eukprot:CAMPEP_0116034002 /NCGR_PEP_ID=MMETSP0321-20121206/19330_1 /TAXON_ID=163516 /ORGANISM="Leptocylindrus danicus var. danicus, Strain B650" /LENGTH=299 /DNA_ID=CAMNT_0003510195 /DNA_START=46 /DNA_END=945 /DNA_ORIENTATION=+